MDTPLLDDQKEMSATIVESGKILLAVLNNTLDISKIESGQIEVENAPFDLIALFDSIGKLFAPKVREKGLSITDKAGGGKFAFKCCKLHSKWQY